MEQRGGALIQKREKLKKQNTTLFRLQPARDPHYTWHCDRGGPYHLCTLLLTFLIWSIVLPLGLLKIYGKMPPPRENAHNFFVRPPKATKLKT